MITSGHPSLSYSPSVCEQQCPRTPVSLPCSSQIWLKMTSLPAALCSKRRNKALYRHREPETVKWLYKAAHIMARGGWVMFRLDICLGYLLWGRRGNVKSFEMEGFGGNVWTFLIKMRKRHSCQMFLLSQL